jgi:oligopeptide transport system permease protein
LGVSTFIVNFTIGAIYGAIEGYYGGVTDLIMERISDILADIPFIVLASIVNIQLISTNKMSPFGAIVFAFVLTGWIGPAYRLRTQFYRFKNQEYVLAARTLGASDARIMWKHIFPNTLGTIITASVLTIPGTIFTESMLSYLNIINLNQGSITSLGTILATGQQYMTTYPHIIIPPCIVISLLMISFNLFGNGLRDAFNPSLRGAEE